MIRRFLAFLHKTVQEHHATLMYTEENPRCPSPSQINTYLPETFDSSNGAAERHTYRPAELSNSNVIPDDFPVFRGHLEKPLLYSFTPLRALALSLSQKIWLAVFSSPLSMRMYLTWYIVKTFYSSSHKDRPSTAGGNGGTDFDVSTNLRHKTDWTISKYKHLLWKVHWRAGYRHLFQ